jgi:DNA replication and repair protein RecF
LSLDRLTIRGFRNLQPTDLAPVQGVNWFYGDNGAGKTSILEAIYLLGRGRSFRASQMGALIQHGGQALSVVAQLDLGKTRLGIERTREDWRGRINGRDSRRISEFAAAVPLVLIEPDSHRLVDGGPDRRRQYLDWQLFHVEPHYLEAWQRYARLLRQRNAALKSGSGTDTLTALEFPMVQAAEQINRLRSRQVDVLAQVIKELVEELQLRLPGAVGLRYRPGHPPERDLADSLVEQRDSDRERGFTQRGPHRAELVLSSGAHPAAAELSRGQQKLLALTLLLAQLVILGHHATRSPLLLLDDPVSELDQDHLDRLLDWVSAREFQCWATATAPPERDFSMFHVEQGVVRASHP